MIVDCLIPSTPRVIHIYICICGSKLVLHMWLTRGYQVEFEPIFFTCNLCCISHVDYLCTFSGVFHVNCFTWINGEYPFMWISGVYHMKNATWFSFTCFSRVFSTWNIGVGLPIHVLICLSHCSRVTAPVASGCRPTENSRRSPALSVAITSFILPNNGLDFTMQGALNAMFDYC